MRIFFNFKPEIGATILVALSGMLYGTIGFFGTQLFRIDHFTVSNMLFWRFMIATVSILFFNMLRKEKLLANLPPPATFIFIFIFGSLFYSMSSAFYFIATYKTGTGLAMVIFFSFPMFVALFSWLTHKWHFNKIAVCALIAMLIGLILLKGEGTTAVSLAGILIAVLAGVSYAFYVMASKHHANTISASLNTFIICCGNALLFLCAALITQSFAFPSTLHAWLYIIVLGVFATALPIQLVLHGLKTISSVKASLLSVLEPVVTLLVGVALLHESMSLMQMLGVITILLAAILIQFEKNAG